MATRSVRWMRQILHLENKGYQAFKDGKTESDNPYLTGYRNQNGPGGQFQQQRAKAWARGFGIAKMEKQNDDSESGAAAGAGLAGTV